MLKKLSNLISKHDDSITFLMLEIGGVPLDGQEEPFYQLLDLFPGSRVVAFEVDKKVCEELNKTSKRGVVFYPFALGEKEETRKFYETTHPMCCSLYQPNEELIRLYNNFEVAYLKSISNIDTLSLDYFARENKIGSVDFIKIDIQGAELDVFKGGVEVLRDVLAIVCEVEFLPHYINQPLFGDVCGYLAIRDLMFHKFLGLEGRALAPIVLDNNPNLSTQHIWSDAVFIRHVLSIPKLSKTQLLKLSILGFIYGSPDLTYYCLRYFDLRQGTKLHQEFLNMQ
jgi:FkbM family methyltransferase